MARKPKKNKQPQRHPTKKQKETRQLTALLLSEQVTDAQIYAGMVQLQRDLGYPEGGIDVSRSEQIMGDALLEAVKRAAASGDDKMLNRLARTLSKVRNEQEARKHRENVTAVEVLHSNVYREYMQVQRSAITGGDDNAKTVEAATAAFEASRRGEGS